MQRFELVLNDSILYLQTYIGVPKYLSYKYYINGYRMYVDIMTGGNRQFMLLIWNSFISLFVDPVREEAMGFRGWIGGGGGGRCFSPMRVLLN